MTTLTSHGRQTVLVIEQPFDYTDIVTAALDGANSKVKPVLPQGAIVVGGGVLVETAFGVGAALAVNSSNSTAYHAGVDLNTAGYTAFTGGVGLKKASGETVYLVPDTEAKASVAGKATLIVQYIIAGRSNEVQP